MIVRQEAHVIRRCLESVRPLVDAWAITDTGSTDDTIAVIRDTMSDTSLGSVRSVVPPKRKWWQRHHRFDFAKHRNIALDHARTFGCDYILLIDADEELRLDAGADGTFPELTHSRYVANFRRIPERDVWHRSLLIRSDEPWYYKWPIHETLHCDTAADEKAAWLGGLEVLSYSDSGRNQNKRKKYLGDAAACRDAIRAEPKEPRHWFYLAQSYAGAEEFQQAIRAYERRIKMGGGWDEELWFSGYQIARLKQILGYHWRDLVSAYMTAWNERPWRAEPLWNAGILYRDNGEPAIGEVLLRQACMIPPPNDSFLVEESVYSWRAADDLTGCLAELGKKDECLDILRRLSESPAVPDEDRKRIVENIELARAA